MSGTNNHESISSLFEQMKGLIAAASPVYHEEFNTSSIEIWERLAEFVCRGTVSIGARFDRTRRMSDFHTLPHDQSPTTLFNVFSCPGSIIEVKAEQVFGFDTAPEIQGDEFVFSLIFPDTIQSASVLWSLAHPRPTLVFDTTQPTDLQ